MPDLSDIPGLSDLRSRSIGVRAATPKEYRQIKIAVLDGIVDLERACFQGANLIRLNPYWAETLIIAPQDLQVYLEIENSGSTDAEKEKMRVQAIPDPIIRQSLYLQSHANHIISTICGQPNSPVEGIVPQATVINIPLAYRYEEFINPLNLSRAISMAIAENVNIIHCAACHPTQSGLAHELIDKAIRQAQANNILIIAPGGNDRGECWCIPAVLDQVLPVGAMKDNGQPFQFSNFGGKYAHQGILAPGENILGAQPGTDQPIRKKGTSCAAAIVTGVAALLMSLQLEGGATPDAEAVRIALTQSVIPCDPQEIEEPERCLLGKLNISGAYERLTGTPLSHQNSVALTATHSCPLAEIPEIEERFAAITSVTPLEKSSQRPQLVYALGTLGYDFGTAARRDTFQQFMAGVSASGHENVGNGQISGNPDDVQLMVSYLAHHPSEAKSLIWTLNLEETPIYAIKPVGAFGAEIYQLLQLMLAGQNLPADHPDYIERINLPGILTDEKVRLFCGQRVTVVKVNSPRGMYGWNVNILIDAALQAVSLEGQERDELMMIRRGLSSFLNRVYHEFRNWGKEPRDRALNFAATNAFQVTQTFLEATRMGMALETINVEKSPFCRHGSECLDVKVKFFHPGNSLRAKQIFRFTIDVSDITPVTVGKIRSWAVSS